MHDFRSLARHAARAASDKKGEDILVFDLRKISDISDFVVIAGADSSAQMRAIQDTIEEALEVAGIRPLRREGGHTARWLALDYGALVVHVMRPEAREFYRLEQLWDGAKAIVWEEPKPPKKKKK